MVAGKNEIGPAVFLVYSVCQIVPYALKQRILRDLTAHMNVAWPAHLELRLVHFVEQKLRLYYVHYQQVHHQCENVLKNLLHLQIQ